jgi:tetratricopeptide (TPR) repeat protein
MRKAFLILALALAPMAACAPQAEDAATAADPVLDGLFAKLKSAPNAAEAAVVEQQIWRAWSQSGSATVDLLVERADAADAAGDHALARKFIEQAAQLLPGFAGIWYRRSIIRYDQDDRAGAIADIQETLAREPRHFGALAGLGLIYEDMGQDKPALEAYRAALDVNPYLDDARQGVARLEPKLEGWDL